MKLFDISFFFLLSSFWRYLNIDCKINNNQEDELKDIDLITCEVTLDVTKLNTVQNHVNVLYIRRSLCRKGTNCNADGYRMEEVIYEISFPSYAIDGYIVYVYQEGHILLHGNNRTRGNVKFIGKLVTLIETVTCDDQRICMYVHRYM